MPSFADLWPNHHTACRGWGGSTSYQSHPYGMGSAQEQMFEPWVLLAFDGRTVTGEMTYAAAASFAHVGDLLDEPGTPILTPAENNMLRDALRMLDRLRVLTS